MEKSPLHIIYADHKEADTKVHSDSKSRKLEMQAAMERRWNQDPEQFNPLRDAIQRQRIAQTLSLIKSMGTLSDKLIVDLGCGEGVLSRMMRDDGGRIHAVDVATNALSRLQTQEMQNITPIHDCLPTTLLKDAVYDGVICTEVIAYLKPSEFRLLMAELARVVKSEGYVACSTALDIDTDNPLERFASLAETEFTIEKWSFSYHVLLIRLIRIFDAPGNFVKGSRDPALRSQELNSRKGLSRFWYGLNSHFILTFFWKFVKWMTQPMGKFLKQNEKGMKVLEKITRFFWADAGISHALFIGKKRPLVFPVASERAPRELKHKKQVWE